MAVFCAGKGHPSDTNNGGYPLFAFDEVHFKLNKSLKKGDKIKISKTVVQEIWNMVLISLR